MNVSAFGVEDSRIFKADDRRGVLAATEVGAAAAAAPAGFKARSSFRHARDSGRQARDNAVAAEVATARDDYSRLKPREAAFAAREKEFRSASVAHLGQAKRLRRISVGTGVAGGIAAGAGMVAFNRHRRSGTQR